LVALSAAKDLAIALCLSCAVWRIAALTIRVCEQTKRQGSYWFTTG
jgi:hypothetical protein